MLNTRKQNIICLIKKNLNRLRNYNIFNNFFHEKDTRYLRFLIEPGSTVLDVGCGNGLVLKELEPNGSIGVDLSNEILTVAKENTPYCTFIEHDVELPLPTTQKFDVVLLSDVIGLFDDIQQVLLNIKENTHSRSRIIISYYTKHWELLIRFMEMIGLKVTQLQQNYLSTHDIHNFLTISGYEVIRSEYQQLIPFKWFGIGTFVNKFIATLPGIRRLCLRTYIVARPIPTQPTANYSVSIVIPCRNEKGNVESAITRLPAFCDDIEIIYVEGHSKDGTWEEIQRVKEKYSHLKIKAFQQTGKGKANAVHLGFEHATGDIFMILDADLTVPPEQLPKFYNAMNTHQGEFINGSRLIYPMENQAMQFLNFLANKTFSWIFSYLLSQRFTDTLCGTKVFFKKDYQIILAQRAFFGDFDPFGDFELIFGASKLNMKVIEIPIRYQARVYGETQISRFRHGFILLKMVLHAYRKLKVSVS